MFSMLPPTPAAHFNYNYTPHHPSPLSSSPLRSSPTPSPLSPRNTNIPSKNADWDADDKMMTSPTPSPSKPSKPQSNTQSIFHSPVQSNPFTSTSTQQTPTPIISLPSPPPSRGKSSPSSTNPPSNKAVFSKRPSKPNPLFHKQGDGAETRRKLFLKRVKEESKEKRWRDRGGDEEIMRVLWVGEERERRCREEWGMKASSLEAELGDVYEDVEREGGLGMGIGMDDGMIDELDIVRNEEELEVRFGEMVRSEGMGRTEESVYGSDDDEYDDIFMDVILEESRASSQVEPTRQQQQEPGYLQDEEMMDMS
ncbi:hypothetical protein B0J14DRAFT_45401 [Halenospora varia]|nr:hypothetical protein B0J14DRAFT_45401 [Halenospora varia]